MRRIVLALCVLLVLAAAVACSDREAAAPPRPRPDRATQIGVGVPIRALEPEDVDYLQQILGTGSSGWESTRLASFPQAQRLFPQALLPTETLGKRLIAITYKSTEETNADPKQVLRLIYEGGLEVGLARYEWGPIGPAEMIPPSREVTEVAGVSAKAELQESWRPGPKETARVKWQVGKLHWTVSGQGLPKSDVVEVARSLEP